MTVIAPQSGTEVEVGVRPGGGWLKRRTRRKLTASGWTTVTFALAIIMFFPFLWMVLTSFKTEGKAYTTPPAFVFKPSLVEFNGVLNTAGSPFLHSVLATGVSTIFVLCLGLPAAYALSVRAVPQWRNTLFFFLSTKMLPYVAAIVPFYMLAKDLHLLDNVVALIILYTAFQLPLAIWVIRSFLVEIPRELLEAARLDGAGTFVELTRVILPLCLPGIAATALICVIFSWDDFFFAYLLTSTRAMTVPIFLMGFVQSENLYFAQLSAAATLASLPVILAGWIAQKQLVRGLSLGAVK
jgi:sorbitol/mannitol transport system permease protein